MKLPFIKFYFSDWSQDTKILTLEQKGAWFEILGVLWNSEIRGEATYSLKLWAQILGIDEAKTKEILEVLKVTKIADVTFCHNDVTLMSRRIKNDECKRINDVKRQRKHRSVTEMSQDGHGQTLDVRSQKLDTRVNKSLNNMSKKFVKPTTEEVKQYSKSIGFDLDAESFIDFYESKGWVVGKSPMKNWQAAVRTWKRKGGYSSGKNYSESRIIAGAASPQEGKYDHLRKKDPMPKM